MIAQIHPFLAHWTLCSLLKGPSTSFPTPSGCSAMLHTGKELMNEVCNNMNNK